MLLCVGVWASEQGTGEERIEDKGGGQWMKLLYVNLKLNILCVVSETVSKSHL